MYPVYDVSSTLRISDVDDAVAEEAIRLNTDTSFLPFLKPRPNKRMWIHLNQGENSWIEGFVERHAIDSTRLSVDVYVYSDDKFRTVRVPPRVIELICRLGVMNVEFDFTAGGYPPEKGE